MNQVVECLKNRRSVKVYRPEQITDEELLQVIEAGMNAPSGGNKQSAVIITVQNRGWLDRLAKLNAQIAGVDFDTFYGAPAILLVLGDLSLGNTQVQDGSLVLGNMYNAAYALGLGSRWINRIKETFETELGQELLQELGLNGEYVGIGSCILRYPEHGYPEPLPRKNGFYYRVR